MLYLSCLYYISNHSFDAECSFDQRGTYSEVTVITASEVLLSKNRTFNFMINSKLSSCSVRKERAHSLLHVFLSLFFVISPNVKVKPVSVLSQQILNILLNLVFYSIHQAGIWSDSRYKSI